MTDAKNLYDAVVIGGGPAGLTAALYLARARYRVLVIEKEQFGGQITITSEVVNYPGVLVASGTELTETMRKQAESFGAEFRMAEVTGLDMSGEIKKVQTTKGEIETHAVLLATGASPRSVGFTGEDEFKGHGVAYCATCDGEFFTGKEVFVVGGGFAAAEEAVFLTKYAKHVTILVRTDDFTCAPAAAEEAKNNDKITVKYNTEVVRAEGDSALRSLTYRNVETGEEETYTADAGDTFGIFVFVGYAPATDLVKDLAETDEYGYIITDEHMATTCPGLYAAGDVCQKPLRQVATAVGQAATTATEMERYIKDAQEKTGLVPDAPEAKPTATAAAAATSEPEAAADDGALLTPDMIAQLNTVFERMEQPLVLRVSSDGTNLASELEQYMNELANLTDKVSVEVVSGEGDDLPKVEVLRAGEPTGLAFHGVPGGHEFTSFVLGLYNAAGPGQPIDDADKAAIAEISKPTSFKVLVGLSCTMCPDVVTAAQRIAADNEQVTADVFDLAHFPQLKEKYNVMSVPCLVVNTGDDENETVTFGRKNLSEILELV